MISFLRGSIWTFVLAVVLTVTSSAQRSIPIPDTLSGAAIDLTIRDTSHSFIPGQLTTTIAYDGSYLGKTLILERGQIVTLNVQNMLQDSTTVHWHGLHVRPTDDGSPHTPILPGMTWSPSFRVLDDAATFWYHPHLHMKTMHQVVKGAAGLIIVRDSLESSLVLPRRYGIDDLPLITQFQSIDPITHQIKINDEADNTILVNGTINGTLSVPAQVARLRMLNASSHRVFRYGFADGRTFHQIASDASLLERAVALTRLTLGPGERAEILVDFGTALGQTLTLRTYGNELPAGYPGGPSMGMMGGSLGPLDNIASDVMQFHVIAQTPDAVTTIPSALRPSTMWPASGVAVRPFALTAQPMMSMTNFFINGAQYREDVINFETQQDRSEIWSVRNQTMMAHPFHVHGNTFYVLDIDGQPAPETMRGKKDVVMIPSGNATVRFITRFESFADDTTPYMYHCHILSHEDAGMMGQFLVRPATMSVATDGIDAGVTVFPQPLTGGATITVRSNDPMRKIVVIDAMGTVQTTIDCTDQVEVTIPAHRSSGLFVIVVTTSSSVHTETVIQVP